MHAGFRHVLGVILALLLLQAVDEPQGDLVPLLGQQHEQEPHADDDGGPQPHHAEDHFVLQQVHGWEERKGQNQNSSRVEDGTRSSLARPCDPLSHSGGGTGRGALRSP